MKTRILLISIVMSALLQSCTLGGSSYDKNEGINTGILQEIEALNQSIYSALQNNDKETFKSFCAPALLQDQATNFDALFPKLNQIVADRNYSIHDQYHVKNAGLNQSNSIFSNIGDPDGYSISYTALNQEVFISTLIPEGNLDQFLLAFVYGKYPEGWKLNILQAGLYKINNKTAPELYAQSLKEYKNGFIVDAALSMYLAEQATKPANTLWKYNKEKEWKTYYEKLVKEVNETYNFPLRLNIQSAPSIINIAPQGSKDGYFPNISYLTNIDINNTEALTAEHEEIHDIIEETFPGITENKSHIIYSAYNSMPSKDTQTPTYRFVKEVY